MIQSFYTSAVSMGQMQKKLDTIGHNMANLNTHGYKRRETTFNDLLFQQLNNQIVPGHEVGRQTPNGLRIGSGGAVGEMQLRYEQGSLQTTDRLLDVALTKPGYFFEVAATEDGTRRFTRDGAFYLSENPAVAGENLLVDSNGDHILSAQGEAISIPGGFEDLLIRENGVIEVKMPGQVDSQVVGQLQLIEVIKPQLLIALGENAFVFPNLGELNLELADVMAEVAGTEVIQQKTLEMSNVDLGQEMTELTLAQRSYQFNARAISITDQMMGLVNNIR